MFGTKISRESNRYRLFINLGSKIENPEPHKIR